VSNFGEWKTEEEGKGMRTLEKLVGREKGGEYGAGQAKGRFVNKVLDH